MTTYTHLYTHLRSVINISVNCFMTVSIVLQKVFMSVVIKNYKCIRIHYECPHKHTIDVVFIEYYEYRNTKRVAVHPQRPSLFGLVQDLWSKPSLVHIFSELWRSVLCRLIPNAEKQLIQTKHTSDSVSVCRPVCLCLSVFQSVIVLFVKLVVKSLSLLVSLVLPRRTFCIVCIFPSFFSRKLYPPLCVTVSVKYVMNRQRVWINIILSFTLTHTYTSLQRQLVCH